MRVAVIVGSEQERDAVLATLGPVHAARLAPYAGARVARVGVGTVIVVPAGAGGAAAAVAAGVVANRARPDALLAMGMPPGEPGLAVATSVTGDTDTLDVAPRLLDALTSRLESNGLTYVRAPTGYPAGWGVATAGAAHHIDAGALTVAGRAPYDAMADAAAAVFATEWWPSAARTHEYA